MSDNKVSKLIDPLTECFECSPHPLESLGDVSQFYVPSKSISGYSRFKLVTAVAKICTIFR